LKYDQDILWVRRIMAVIAILLLVNTAFLIATRKSPSDWLGVSANLLWAWACVMLCRHGKAMQKTRDEIRITVAAMNGVIIERFHGEIDLD
jgi:hypothetical protein